MKPRALILSGNGINCEDETKFAFEQVGGKADIIHINDIISRFYHPKNYQIFNIPGGFSYGDDSGAGNALANRIRNHLQQEIMDFVESGKLVIGICNGFQVLVNLGLVPAISGYGNREVALVDNTSARYDDRWVDLQFTQNSPWTRGVNELSIPIAHGEGRFYAEPEILKEIKSKNLVAARYIRGDVCKHLGLEANPNGSLDDIAAITDETGRILGIMPHPERAVHFTQFPYWTFLKEKYKREGKELPEEGAGLQIFRKGVDYFK